MSQTVATWLVGGAAGVLLTSLLIWFDSRSSAFFLTNPKGGENGQRLAEGQRGGFDPLCEVYEANSREAWPRALEAAGFTPQASHSLTRLDSAWGQLERARVASRADLARSVAAWDLGRAVAIARAAHDCGYLSPSDAWNVINEAGAKAAAIYGDWREFAAGYLIGRCLWGGSRNLGEFVPLAKRYLEDKESPWRKIPLASLRRT
jgi:hypothetical protein